MYIRVGVASMAMHSMQCIAYSCNVGHIVEHVGESLAACMWCTTTARTVTMHSVCSPIAYSNFTDVSFSQLYHVTA